MTKTTLTVADLLRLPRIDHQPTPAEQEQRLRALMDEAYGSVTRLVKNTAPKDSRRRKSREGARRPRRTRVSTGPSAPVRAPSRPLNFNHPKRSNSPMPFERRPFDHEAARAAAMSNL